MHQPHRAPHVESFRPTTPATPLRPITPLPRLRRPGGLLVLIVACLVFTGAPAVADVLVTHDGQRIETEGPWEIKGRQVLFTTAAGVLSALRLTEVDLEASEEASKEPADAEAPAERTSREPRLGDLPQRAYEEPVLVLTNDDVGSANNKELEGLARAFGGSMMQALREAGAQLTESGEFSAEDKEAFDREVTEKERLIQQGYEEVLLSLASVAKRYPQLREIDVSDRRSVRRNAVAISSAAKELRVSAHQIQTEPGRILLNAVAAQLEAVVANI